MKPLLTTLAVAFLLVFACGLAQAGRKKPALVIECARGGVINHWALLAHGAECVGSDAFGGHFSVKGLAAFEEPPPGDEK